jgi:hypothetical protein
VADVSNLVGYDATLLGNWFPTLRDEVFILSSGACMNKKEILRKFSSLQIFLFIFFFFFL